MHISLLFVSLPSHPATASDAKISHCGSIGQWRGRPLTNQTFVGRVDRCGTILFQTQRIGPLSCQVHGFRELRNTPYKYLGCSLSQSLPLSSLSPNGSHPQRRRQPRLRHRLGKTRPSDSFRRCPFNTHKLAPSRPLNSSISVGGPASVAAAPANIG